MCSCVAALDRGTTEDGFVMSAALREGRDSAAKTSAADDLLVEETGRYAAFSLRSLFLSAFEDTKDEVTIVVLL